MKRQDEATGRFLPDQEAIERMRPLVWERASAEDEATTIIEPVAEFKPMPMAQLTAKGELRFKSSAGEDVVLIAPLQSHGSGALDINGKEVQIGKRARAARGAHKATCKCGALLDRAGQRYCSECHAGAQRKYRERRSVKH